MRKFPKVKSADKGTELPSAAIPEVAPALQAKQPSAAIGAGAAIAPTDAPSSASQNDDRSLIAEKRNDSQASLFTRKRLLYTFISVLALPLLAVIGSVAYNMVINKGIMPAPSLLARYECPGFNGSILFYYRHGKDDVQIRSNSGKLDGIIHYGKIEWYKFSGDTTLLGFTPPDEITNDDAKSIRISGGSFKEIDCVIAEHNAVSP